MKKYLLTVLVAASFFSCKKNSAGGNTPASFSLTFTIDGKNNGTNSYNNVSANPAFVFSFTAPVAAASLNSNFSLVDNSNAAVAFTLTMQGNDSMAIVRPSKALSSFSKYTL